MTLVRGNVGGAVRGTVGGQSVAQYAVTEAERLILDERRRQMQAATAGGEEYSPEHDDQHVAGELAIAASCYAEHAGKLVDDAQLNPTYPFHPRWPWDAAHWKPKGDALRCLAIAGALIIAEIERLMRAPPPAQLVTPNAPSPITAEQVTRAYKVISRSGMTTRADVQAALVAAFAPAEQSEIEGQSE